MDLQALNIGWDGKGMPSRIDVQIMKSRIDQRESMPEDYKVLVHNAVMDEQRAVRPTFVRATFSGNPKDSPGPWSKVVLRPVRVKGRQHLQFSYYDAKRCIAKNYREDVLAQQLQELLGLPFRNIQLSTTSEELRINIDKEDQPVVHRSRTRQLVDVPGLTHDRQKDLLLPEGKPDAFLQAIGFMTQDGQIKADRQKKFKQTNEFLKLIEQTGELEKFGRTPLEVVDFGCGNAYLTFAVYHYLNNILHIPARIVGVDVRGDLLEKHARTVEELGWSDLTFDQNRIAEFVPSAPPDITLALHACDTATDEAIAQGIRWNSALIISVPCCHHHLQEQLSHSSIPEPFRPVSRHGILMERMGDVLTDAFRALILRIMGYQTDVMQFISAEHTAKNVMIRSVKANPPGSPQHVREYLSMKEYWQVTPYLENLLGSSLTDLLAPSRAAETGFSHLSAP